MEENTASNECNIDEIMNNNKQEKISNNHKQKNIFKEKICDVISYNKKERTLDVVFDNFGVRLKNIDNFKGDKALIKYKGEIGKSNFICKM